MDAGTGTIPTAGRSAFRATLFGAIQLARPDGTELTLSNRRARALLAMLCLSPGEQFGRQHVSRLLWPGRFPAQARASLRQCLLAIDKALGECGDPPLAVSRERIAIEPNAWRSDLADLEAALAELRIDDAIGLIETIGNRKLLDQMDFGEAFAEWLLAERDHVDGRMRMAVEKALSQLAASGEVVAQRALQVAWVACGRAERKADDRIRIAILPFEQFDATGGEYFLAEGVTEELTNRLGSVERLAVIGRTSATSVAANGGTLEEMARSLDAAYLVEGATHLFAHGIRITMRLIDGASGTEVWSDRWDGTVEDLMATRGGLGDDVVTGLCAAMGVRTGDRRVRKMTESREAYALYLQGRALTYRIFGGDILMRARSLLERALEIDPDFAECWTALAETHVSTLVFRPCIDKVERSALAAECARKAIALDPAQGHAHTMLAIHAWTEGEPMKALDLAFEGYRLEPTNADVTIRVGAFLAYIGRSRDALPYIEEAIALDPVYARNYAMLSAVELNLGHPERAIAAGETMVNMGMPALWLAVAQAAVGRHDEAVQTYYDARFLVNTMILPPAGTTLTDEARDAYFMIAAKGIASGVAEDRAFYCRLIDGLHQTLPDPYEASIAFPAVFMGHAELVMKVLREQIHPANMFCMMSIWADVDPIRRIWQHPDFLQFARETGFVEAWENYGWPDVLPRPVGFAA